MDLPIPFGPTIATEQTVGVCANKGGMAVLSCPHKLRQDRCVCVCVCVCVCDLPLDSMLIPKLRSVNRTGWPE